MENVEQAPPGDGARIEDNVKSRSTWMRFVYMLACGLLYFVTRFVIFVVVVLQFLWLLLTGEANARLAAAGQTLATYTYQLVSYLTFASDTRPFPFDEDWPSTKPLD